MSHKSSKLYVGMDVPKESIDLAGGEPGRKIAGGMGVPEQSIRNWVKAQTEGKLGSAEKGKPITPEQIEISRLRAENARLKMEMEIVKKAAAYFAKESL